MSSRRGTAPAKTGTGTSFRASETRPNSTCSDSSAGQRNAASWAVAYANRWREERDTQRIIAVLEARVAQLERLASGEQIP